MSARQQRSHSQKWEVEPNSPGPEPHVHQRHEELFYVLEGEFVFELNDREVRASPGTFVAIPAGVRHTFSNPLSTVSRLLITVSPPDLEQYFERLAELFAQADGGVLSDLEFRQAMRELRARYDTFEV